MSSCVHFLTGNLRIILSRLSIPLFAVSTLAPSSWSTPPVQNVYIPPRPCEPKSMCRVWAASGCAERKAGVGVMRDENDLPLDV
ncbi:hypothetical protein BS17DRAFT_134941 [Gyrodon lividus]|nr:hypothetical protein BS17DRAFT_134941 [Gyrodon lividus]